MNKIIAVIALVLTFGLGSVFANAYAGGGMAKGWPRTYEVSRLLGAELENPLGEAVGTIQDFVFDSHGHIDFVILSHNFWWEYVPMPSQTVAVPFSEITVKPNEGISILKFSGWKLDFVPKFDKSDMNNRKWAENVYRYFGLQPYWTEGGHTGSMNPYRWGGEAQDF
jgi:sporulation protein YlmC with PRC-barrel domain